MSESKNAEAQEQQAQEQQAPVDLSVQDLAVIRSIIDVASTRGAFKADELEAVGKTYNKLNAFLSTIEKQAEEAKATDGEK